MFQAYDWIKSNVILTGSLLTLMGLTAFVADANARTSTFISAQKTNYSGDKPEQCFRMPAGLRRGTHQYADYIQLKGAGKSVDQDEAALRLVPTAVKIRGSQLCLRGLQYGSLYEVAFFEGLPFEKDEVLSDTVLKTFTTHDRPAAIHFQNNTFVLPTSAHQSVPLEIINVSDITVRAYRLSPEVLNEYLRLGRFGRPLDGSEVKRWLTNGSAEIIGRQEFQLAPQHNRKTTYNLDVSALLAAQKPGAYVLIVESDDEKLDQRWRDNRPTQFLLFTDMGLMSFHGEVGLDVYARSYETGEVIADTEIQLVARNHDILATVTTDGKGRAHFPDPLMQGQAGLKPALVRALGSAGQFSVLDLSKKHLDLSDRPISGAEPWGLINAYLFAERGVYRPGEHAVVTGIVRDRSFTAPMDLPLTLKLMRPDGKESTRTLITNLEAGGFQHRFDLPLTGRTGLWHAQLFLDPEGTPIGSTPLLIEDYVPATVEATVESAQTFYSGQAVVFEFKADYFFGAPASDLEVENQVAITTSNRLFAQWPEHVFGHIDTAVNRTVPLQNGTTDADGRYRFTFKKNVVPEDQPDLPLKLTVHSGIVEPNGRVTRDTLALPVLQHPSWVGIRAENDHETFAVNTIPLFNLVNVGRDGTALPGREIAYEVVREKWDYHWYYRRGWDYTIDRYDDHSVTTGTLKTNAAGLASVTLDALEWGRYRLEVVDLVSGQRTSLRFRVGWWNAEGQRAAIPDHVQMALSQPSAQYHDKVTVKIVPPYSGKLHFVVANREILEERELDITEKGAVVEFSIDPDWGSGVYLLATVYRVGKQGPGPARAVGVSYVEISRPDLHAETEIRAPETTTPNHTIEVDIDTSLESGGRVFLAAVDEGILQLTRFKSPDPKAYFLRKQRLGVAITDLYGHLIQHEDGETLRLHFGGDTATDDARAQPPKTFVKPVALVSALVDTDAQGHATVSLDVPQFNGRLRLMAVAFDDRRMGSFEVDMTVRDPLVVTPILPRFLTMGDKADLGVTLHNVDAQEGIFTLSWQVTEGLHLIHPGQSVRLQVGDQTNMAVRLQALRSGEGKVALVVTRPDGHQQKYEWDLPVLENRFRIQKTQSVSLAPGQVGQLENALLDFAVLSRDVRIRVTDKPIIDASGLFASLSRYPFGCLEQTTSKAWPVLFVTPGTEGWTRKRQRRHISQAIQHLAQMQLSSGAFSLWRGGRDAKPWLTMYALDFLLTAKERGFEVQETLLADVLAYVRAYDGDNRAARAYALYLSTRTGDVDRGALRYFYTTTLNQNNRALNMTYMHIGRAFDLLGDTARRDTMYAAVDWRTDSDWVRANYGSFARDVAAAMLYIWQSQNPDQAKLVPDRVYRLFEELYEQRYLSTQEKAWLLRVAHLLNNSDELPPETSLQVDQDNTTIAALRDVVLRSRHATVRFKNTSDGHLVISLTSSGHAERFAEADQHKIGLEKIVLDLNTSQAIELQEVKQGQEVLVQIVIDVKSSHGSAEISLEDPVPAGFEIENPRLTGGRSLDALSDMTEPDFQEYRDDRFMAAWTLKGRGFWTYLAGDQLKVAYIMRAVTPGSFLVPATQVEDMYRPHIRANTKESRVVVRAKNH